MYRVNDQIQLPASAGGKVRVVGRDEKVGKGQVGSFPHGLVHYFFLYLLLRAYAPFLSPFLFISLIRKKV